MSVPCIRVIAGSCHAKDMLRCIHLYLSNFTLLTSTLAACFMTSLLINTSANNVILLKVPAKISLDFLFHFASRHFQFASRHCPTLTPTCFNV